MIHAQESETRSCISIKFTRGLLPVLPEIRENMRKTAEYAELEELRLKELRNP